MTETEKMQAGLLYDANDAALEQARLTCKERCQAYNRLPIRDLEGRRAALRQLLGRTGETLHIEPDLWCDYGRFITVGERFYANHGLVILDAGGVSFGDDVFLGPNCGFYTSGHPIDVRRRNDGLEYALPIRVGSNVWMGAGVHVLPGVTIGDNVVIGAGSVVVHDLPSDCVAVGNPCRAVRPITEEDGHRTAFGHASRSE